MNDFVKKVEDVLTPMARDYTPSGTLVEAVVHQWVHAIADGTDLFASGRGIVADDGIRLLKNADAYQTQTDFSKAVRNSVPLRFSEKHSFRFIDLFAGIGGMRQGFEKAGGRCVFSSEFDKYAQRTYFENYGELLSETLQLSLQRIFQSMMCF